MSLNFKKAIIIGGSKGLGKQISQNIKSLGVKTYSCSRKEIDTSDLASVKKFIKKHKSTDILVLNSGGPPPLKLSKISINDWKKYFNQLFLSFFIILQNIKVKRKAFLLVKSKMRINNNLLIDLLINGTMSENLSFKKKVLQYKIYADKICAK